MDDNIKAIIEEYAQTKVELEVLKYQVGLLKDALRKDEVESASRSAEYAKNHPEENYEVSVRYGDVSGKTIRAIFGWEISAEATEIINNYYNREDK